MKADLHIHSTISDGTDSPQALLNKIRQTNIEIFSLTDHDDSLGCEMLEMFLEDDDPLFIPGIELSAEKEGKKYHILGYAYERNHPLLLQLTKKVHDMRIYKVSQYIQFVEDEYGFIFSSDDKKNIMEMPNPGKPHIASMMMKYDYVDSISEGIEKYIDKHHVYMTDISPEEAISTILTCGGIPVLAHGIYADGREHLSYEELDERVAYLTHLGLQGMECYYSKYSDEEQQITKKICEKYDLLATAGSDYHGKNKKVELGQNGLDYIENDERVMRFIQLCKQRLENNT